jgi:hypothetical protein
VWERVFITRDPEDLRIGGKIDFHRGVVTPHQGSHFTLVIIVQIAEGNAMAHPFGARLNRAGEMILQHRIAVADAVSP